MPTIIRSLPYFDHETKLVVAGRQESVKVTQIVVWVSISDVGQEGLESTAPRFPAILDTGLSHNLAIRAEHLNRWAGMDRRTLRKLRDIRINGRLVPLHEADAWLHPNIPGNRDPSVERPPFPLQLESGIAIYPEDFPAAPRLPLIGLRALQWSKLHLSIDCEHRRVSIGLRPWFWLRW